ncbi:CotH kinase family protein [Pseudobacteroides cellulosolvens]|uniref:Spore coat protein CotH n=1 Tax=Pseudobacteroides cellulosolvens ATCC 35603 = DSM 2933 TaxID=398512 RepID=A0A0L6JID0_9FIRM|nr:CotH kinase family protein [Pseudobacteroides cellulosolvens]KNY25207.1 Spore coat protein CotH [Pseudobacteroides cellulosolvens ATCC 35603 = DSM 2933]
MFREKRKFIIPFVITSVIFSNIFSVGFAADTNPPAAKFEISNVTPALNEAITFDASSSSDAEGAVVSYEWDFKDGTTATGARVTHSFTEIDDYNVTLTVKDSAGNTDIKKKRVFIGRPQGWTEKTHSKSADPDYKLIFPDDKVLRMDIKISSADYQKIRNDVQKITINSNVEPIYVPSTVEFEGKTWWNVGFRYKGNSSLASLKSKTKLPFRLNFDEYEDQKPEINDQHFFGFSCMTFANNWNDNSFMKEKLTAEIFREGGVPAAKSSFCRVYVDTGNGPKYWGLYTMTEDPSDAMLKDQFGDDSGNCYKPEGTGADWTSPFRQTAFEKKNNEEAADWSDVIGAHTALWAAKTDAATWRANLEKYFNSRSFLRWLAINTAVVNWDCYGQMAHNYYLYNDVLNNAGLVWITWDHGLSMSQSMMGGGFGGGFGGSRTTSLSLNEVTDRWPLIRKLLDDPVYKNIYHYEMQQAINGCMNASKITTKVKAYQALIKPYIVGPEGETSDVTLLSGGENAFNSACDAILTHINSRQTAVNDYLKTVSISPVPVPTKVPSPTPTQKPSSTPTTPVVSEDLNNDGIVNMADIILIATTFNSVTGNEKYNKAYDLSNDGSINMLDVIIMAKKFNTVRN